MVKNMFFNRLLLAGVIGTLAMSTPLSASAQDGKARPTTAKERSAQLRRDWLHTQVRKLVKDPAEAREWSAKIDALDDDGIQDLSAIILQQLEAKRQVAATALQLERQRDVMAREAAAQAEADRWEMARRNSAMGFGGPWYMSTPGPVGFMPIVTWFPEGASLNAQAVISPDGRHVRVNANPFFSSIGPVDTFNFYTGETRRIMDDPNTIRQPAPVSTYRTPQQRMQRR